MGFAKVIGNGSAIVLSLLGGGGPGCVAPQRRGDPPADRAGGETDGGGEGRCLWSRSWTGRQHAHAMRRRCVWRRQSFRGVVVAANRRERLADLVFRVSAAV